MKPVEYADRSCKLGKTSFLILTELDLKVLDSWKYDVLLSSDAADKC